MIPKEILQNVRRIEITTSRLVTDVFAGQYHSVFKGLGIEFDEVREYQPGDDIRTIDWNVTARTGVPHVKKYVEERELTLMILVDASLSCRFASVNQLKSKLAAEIAAVLAFSAIKNNDKVGLIIFTDRIEEFIPPRKGLKHILRIIRDVLYVSPRGRGTDIIQSLDYLNKVTTRKTATFIISDFLFEDEIAEDFRKALSVANKRHDIMAVTLNDPREIELPDCGLIHMEDAETGERIIIDSSDENTRKAYKEDALARVNKRNRILNQAGVDQMDISTDKPYIKEMSKFFIRRKKRSK